MKLCKCGKTIKGNYKQCYECNQKSKSPLSAGAINDSSNPLNDTDNNATAVHNIEDRILRSQCLNIASEQLHGNTSKQDILEYAKKLYQIIKEDGWL